MYATGFYTLSDSGVKGGIRPLEAGSLDRVCALTPAQWEWRGAGRDTGQDASGYGFIAQDVAHVFPELVRGVDGEMRIDVMGLLAHVIGAIKELRRGSS